MAPTAQKIASLIVKYIAGEISPEEMARLEEYLQASNANRQAFTELTSPSGIKSRLPGFYNLAGASDACWERIESRLNEKPKPVLPTYPRPYAWMRYVAAAMVILTGGVLAYILTGRKTSIAPPKPIASQLPAHDVLPGGNKAVLTLANGSTIVLDSARTGLLAEQGNTHVTQTVSGQLLYKIKDGSVPLTASAEIAFNTLATPRGGQYQLTLPDGSKVWLNAASSIRYPAVFTGHERQVYIKGEAYFEIAHLTKDGKRVPFRVNIDSSHAGVEVLGTHFNINAYTDEEGIKATLMEGLVSISGAGAACVLRPGQQALIKDSQPVKITSQANLEEIMAWKDGFFKFTGAGIDAIMRELARWYDLQVEYEGKIEGSFSGKIPRNVTLTDVFKILKATDRVQLKIDGKKVTVSPIGN